MGQSKCLLAKKEKKKKKPWVQPLPPQGPLATNPINNQQIRTHLAQAKISDHQLKINFQGQQLR